MSVLAPAAAPADTADALLPPWLAERYEPLGVLGRGGASVVVRARDRAEGWVVAVKLVALGADAAGARARFARERRVGALLDHPHVVRTLAAEERGGVAAFVTEYVAGGTLRAALGRDGGEPWPYARVAAVLRDVAAALAHAHARGVVHCDVKPENVLLDGATGAALLGDFGIAVVLGDPVLGTSEATGTPAYMAPEQIAGGPVDARADVYALGLVGWELLAGRRPWAGEPLHAVLHRQQHDPLPPLADLRPDVPAYLLSAVEGALAKTPDGRWRDGAEFLRRLSPTPVRLPPVVVPAAEDPSAVTVRFAEAAGSMEAPAVVPGAPGTNAGRRRGRAMAAAGALGVSVAAVVWAAVGPPTREPGGTTATAAPRGAAALPAARPPATVVLGGVVATPAPGVASGAATHPIPFPRLLPRAASASPAATPAGVRPSDVLPASLPAAARRRIRNADADVARAFAGLAAAMRQSAGGGHEPRALTELLAEQRRWEDEGARACGVARDVSCLVDRAARKVWDLERRRARFVLDGGPDGRRERP